MAQTILGLTFLKALQIARDADACPASMARLELLDGWEGVLKSGRLRGWLDWFSYVEVPLDDCDCNACEAKRERVTPEKQARAAVLQAIYLEAMALDAGPQETQDAIEAALREHLKEVPDASR